MILVPNVALSCEGLWLGWRWTYLAVFAKEILKVRVLGLDGEAVDKEVVARVYAFVIVIAVVEMRRGRSKQRGRR